MSRLPESEGHIFSRARLNHITDVEVSLPVLIVFISVVDVPSGIVGVMAMRIVHVVPPDVPCH
ncbi:hypothetical protein D3C79_985450 [compost metagenome]